MVDRYRRNSKPKRVAKNYWLYKKITDAYPTNKYKRKAKNGILTQHINLTYEEGSEYYHEELLSEAKVYLEFLKEERAVDRGFSTNI